MPDAVTTAPLVKGSGVRQFFAYYARVESSDAVAAAIAGMPPDLGSMLDARDPYLGVLDSIWYPAAVFHSLLDQIVPSMPPQLWAEILRKGAHAAMAATLTGVYRLLFNTMMTPDRYAKNGQKLFSRYFNTGTMTKTPLLPRGHLSVITDWTSHHPVLCELITYTGEYVYGALGCKDVTLERTACVSRGASECRFIVRWS